MIILHNDNNNVLTNEIYKYKIINNVVNYKCEDFNKWNIEIIENNEKNDNFDIYYLIIDTEYNEAFSHWVFECAIYLPLFLNLKKIYPTLKLHLKTYKKYKKIFCDYFNISKDDITLELDLKNICIFPLPISCMNDISMCCDYKIQLEFFIDKLKIHCNNQKWINTLLLPRQKLENLKENDRNVITDDIALNIINDKNNTILNTDFVNKLEDQIKTVNSSKNIILSAGSAYFVNGLFCENSTIIVLGDFIVKQISIYQKFKYIHNKIIELNKVHFIPMMVRKNIFTYDNIKQYLII